MKRHLFLLICVGLALLTTGCHKGFDTVPDDEWTTNDQASENAKKLFGVGQSATQDWVMTRSGNVNIVPNADLENIVKVQVLTAPPMSSGYVRVLNEAEVHDGQAVSLAYDAPKSLKRLYAACVDAEGHYFIKGFAPGQQEVNFQQTSRANAPMTRMSVDRNAPTDPTKVKLRVEWYSYNAARAINATPDNEAKLWLNSGWENERIYLVGTTNAQKVDEEYLMQEVDDFDEDTKADLQDIVNTYLPGTSGRLDNFAKILASDIYTMHNNYLESDGINPITITPILMNSTEIDNCHICFFYFKQSEYDQLASEEEKVQFLKDLPKYKLAEPYRTSRFLTDRSIVFRRHVITVPFFGDGKPTLNQIQEGQSFIFPEGYKIGFFLSKGGNNGTHVTNGVEDWKRPRIGNTYGDGRLNQEINLFGDFASSMFEGKQPRQAIFGCNKKSYICFEDGSDANFNDLVVEINGAKPTDIQYILDKNVYTLMFEDTEVGDYDLNDVVLTAQRIDRTHVKYALQACGAHDELYLRNINGSVLNGDKEVHAYFNVGPEQFVNTVRGAQYYEPVADVVEVAPDFNFTQWDLMPYIYDKTKNHEVRLARTGQPPYAVIVPTEMAWPQERTRIDKCYGQFITWMQDETQCVDWYMTFDPSKTFAKPEQ